MPEALGDERWAAIRAICEGAAPTNERVALAAGIYVKTISRKATAEGWRMLDFRRPRVRTAQKAMVEIAARAAAGEELDPVDEDADEAEDGAAGAALAIEPLAIEPLADLPPFERAQWLQDMLTRRSEEMLQRAAAGQPIESRQVAALSAMVGLAERIGALSPEDLRQHSKASDDELAAMLEKIDERIVVLAAAHARNCLLALGLSEREADITEEYWLDGREPLREQPALPAAEKWKEAEEEAEEEDAARAGR